MTIRQPSRQPWAPPVATLEDVAAAPEAVKSAGRAFRVVEFFDEIRRPARAAEISRRLGWPQSSTSVLLNSLMRLGYLDYEPATRAYLPSIRTAVLAAWRDNGCFRDGTMLDTMERLARDSGLASCLSVRNGIHTRYLHVVQHFGPGDVHITLTARRFAVQSAAGIVLIAHLPDTEIRTLLHRTRAENPEAPPLAVVLDRVREARATGFFVSDGLVTFTNGAVALRLPPAVTGGWQDMALSIAGDRSRVVGRAEEHASRLAGAIARLTAGPSPM